LDLLMGSIAEAVITTDLDFRIRTWNRSAEELYGWSVEEVIGKGMGEVVPTRFAYERSENVIARFRAEGTWKGEAIQKRKDGSEVIVLASVTLVRDREGNPTDIVAVNRDITKQSQAAKAIDTERERARAYFDIAGVIMVVLDRDGRVSLINRKGCEILGREKEDVIGRDWFETFVPEGARGSVQGVFRNLMAGLIEPVEYFENPVLAAGGEERLIAWHNTVLRDDDGGIAGTLGSGNDVTEQRRARVNLEHALSEIAGLKEQLEAENIYIREELKMCQIHGDIVCKSEAMKTVMARAERVAATDSTVLILGETGAGKERLAQAIQAMSTRRNKPLVTINCAALAPALVQSELFGHERGAYTDASSRRIGRFEAADGGTVFLDEIGDLSGETQAKLLRVLQEGEFERLGGTQTISVDIRVIAATNRDLERAVGDGKFREDLFYRLNVFPITIPPLRERREDVPVLAQVFIEEFNRKMGRRVRSVSRRSMRALEEYGWPGNVRELRNVIERAMIGASGDVLDMDVPKPTAGVGSQTLEEVERRHMVRVLEGTGWRVRGSGGAAEILGLKPTTLESRLRKLGIRRPH
jgi:formate hydrogenlyase transcriptional activator